MIDFTTTAGATVPAASQIQPEMCAQCYGPIVGGRKRKYCKPSCRKDARADRARNHVRTAKEAEYQRDYQIIYRQTASGIRSQLRSKKKGRIDGTQGYRTREVYLASMKRRNHKRRKKQLAYYHEHHTKYAGTDVTPTCATCGIDVPYRGSGRPRRRCPAHHLGRGVRR